MYIKNRFILLLALQICAFNQASQLPKAAVAVHTENPTEIFAAIAADDAAKLDKLEIDINQLSPVKIQNHLYQLTPLMFAAYLGKVNIVRLLLERGAIVDIANNLASTALIWASYGHNCNSSIIDLLIKAGADYNKQNIYGRTPLILASCVGASDCLKILLQAKADVNKKDNQGFTALMFGALKEKSVSVDLLLKAGARVNDQNTLHGRTALMLAVIQGNSAIVRRLLEARADVNIQATSDGKTALMLAVIKGNAAIVRILLDAQADIYIQDKIGCTALAEATIKENLEIMNLLIDKHDLENRQRPVGAHISESYFGNLALIGSVLARKTAALKLLLRAQKNRKIFVDQTKQSLNGKNALEVALAMDNTPAVKLLLMAPITTNINVNDPNKAINKLVLNKLKGLPETLAWAIANSNVGLARRTIKLLKNIFIYYKDGYNPLHIAMANRRRILKDFPNAKNKVDLVNKLHENAQIIKLLIWVNPSLLFRENLNGVTPFTFCLNNDQELLKIILRFAYIGYSRAGSASQTRAVAQPATAILAINGIAHSAASASATNGVHANSADVRTQRIVYSASGRYATAAVSAAADPSLAFAPRASNTASSASSVSRAIPSIFFEADRMLNKQGSSKK